MVIMVQNEIIPLIRFYKEDKITEHVLEQELTMKLSGAKKIIFDIISDKKSSPSSTFGLALLPYEDCGIIKGKMLIDKAVFNIYEPAEILKMLDLELSNYQQRISKFYRFIKKHENPPVSESLVFFLKLYKETLITIKSLDFNKISKAGILPKEDTIDELIKSAESGECPLHELIERISVSDVLPNQIIDAAKNLSDHLNGAVVIRVVENGEDVNDLPSINMYHSKIQSVCTSTYGGYPFSTPIKHNYTPETNQ